MEKKQRHWMLISAPGSQRTRKAGQVYEDPGDHKFARSPLVSA